MVTDYNDTPYQVEIHLKLTSRVITHKVKNTYEKGSFYCLESSEGNKVYKYPIADIWRIKQDMS